MALQVSPPESVAALCEVDVLGAADGPAERDRVAEVGAAEGLGDEGVVGAGEILVLRADGGARIGAGLAVAVGAALHIGDAGEAVAAGHHAAGLVEAIGAAAAERIGVGRCVLAGEVVGERFGARAGVTGGGELCRDRAGVGGGPRVAIALGIRVGRLGDDGVQAVAEVAERAQLREAIGFLAAGGIAILGGGGVVVGDGFDDAVGAGHERAVVDVHRLRAVGGDGQEARRGGAVGPLVAVGRGVAVERVEARQRQAVAGEAAGLVEGPGVGAGSGFPVGAAAGRREAGGARLGHRARARLVAAGIGGLERVA